jgi:hypothetical protein
MTDMKNYITNARMQSKIHNKKQNIKGKFTSEFCGAVTTVGDTMRSETKYSSCDFSTDSSSTATVSLQPEAALATAYMELKQTINTTNTQF